MTKIKPPGKYSNLLGFLICFFILFMLFRWIHFLVDKNYLYPGTYLESFTLSNDLYNNTENTNSQTDIKTNINDNNAPYEMYKVNKNHNNVVDMPAFSKYTCSNWCGPRSQCLLSREQCTSDVDCNGCHNLRALNNFYEDSTTDIGQSYMNKSEKDLPKSADEDILCGSCNNNFAPLPNWIN